MICSLQVNYLAKKVKINSDFINMSWYALYHHGDTGLVETIYKRIFPHNPSASIKDMFTAIKPTFIPKTNQVFNLDLSYIPEELLLKLLIKIPSVVVIKDKSSNHFIASLSEETHSMFNIAYTYKLLNKDVPREILETLKNKRKEDKDNFEALSNFMDTYGEEK